MANREFKTAVVGCVTALAEAFGRTVSEATFGAYVMGLEGLTVEQVKEASRLALAKCRFMPPPSELREMIYLRTDDRAVKAWLVFEAAVVKHGYIRSVDFDDPIINATVKAMGGWEHCCGLPAAEFDTFLQKRFQETYCALARTGVSADQAAPLIGFIDRENAKNGFSVQPVAAVDSGLPKLPNRVRPAVPISNRPNDIPRLELKGAE